MSSQMTDPSTELKHQVMTLPTDSSSTGSKTGSSKDIDSSSPPLKPETSYEALLNVSNFVESLPQNTSLSQEQNDEERVTQLIEKYLNAVQSDLRQRKMDTLYSQPPTNVTVRIQPAVKTRCKKLRCLLKKLMNNRELRPIEDQPRHNQQLKDLKNDLAKHLKKSKTKHGKSKKKGKHKKKKVNKFVPFGHQQPA